MSLNVYHKGILLADRVAISTAESLPYTSEMIKLHISKSLFFAYTYCGDRLLQRNFRLMDEAIMAMLLKHSYDKRTAPLVVFKEYEHVFGDRSIIIMTRDQVFFTRADKTFSELDTSDWLAFGTYSPAWRVAASSGLSTVKAAQVAVDYVTQKKYPIDHINVKQLKPFPVVTDKLLKVLGV